MRYNINMNKIKRIILLNCTINRVMIVVCCVALVLLILSLCILSENTDSFLGAILFTASIVCPFLGLFSAAALNSKRKELIESERIKANAWKYLIESYTDTSLTECEHFNKGLCMCEHLVNDIHYVPLTKHCCECFCATKLALMTRAIQEVDDIYERYNYQSIGHKAAYKAIDYNCLQRDLRRIYKGDK